MAHWETEERNEIQDEQKNYRTYGLTIKKTKMTQFGGYKNEIENTRNSTIRIQVSQSLCIIR